MSKSELMYGIEWGDWNPKSIEIFRIDSGVVFRRNDKDVRVKRCVVKGFKEEFNKAIARMEKTRE
jgi:hypothetical protein